VGGFAALGGVGVGCAGDLKFEMDIMLSVDMDWLYISSHSILEELTSVWRVGVGIGVRFFVFLRDIRFGLFGHLEFIQGFSIYGRLDCCFVYH
jgi:hypothetical protein